MRPLFIVLILIYIFAIPVNALDFTAPVVPESGAEYMPPETNSFTEDMFYIIKTALRKIRPEITEAASLCLSILVSTLFVALLQNFDIKWKRLSCLVGAVVIGNLMLLAMNTMTDLGEETVMELSDYGKLLLPVMTAALASQGRVNTSSILYVGTVLFSSLLTTIISKLLLPMIQLLLCCSIANCAIGEGILKRLCGFIKWSITWGLKIVLYVFTGYLTITGVISGTVDAAALKATKLTISGVVPVVGNILADASETILISTDVMKTTVGTYGLLAFAAILIGPFMKIAVQYVMVKLTAAVSEVFGANDISHLINDYSSSMGFLLAMTGSVCLLLMVSVVCFMKGVV